MRARAVFRADGSRARGGGHLVRCAAIADALLARGWTTDFASTAESFEVVPRLARHPYGRIVVDADRPTRSGALCSRLAERCDLLVVDHHDWTRDDEAACRSVAARIAVVDGQLRAHDCDVLLDPTPGRDPGAYHGLVPTGATLLLGPRHAPVRTGFVARRSGVVARIQSGGELCRVAIMLGATDPSGLTPGVIATVRAVLPGARIDVIVGASVEIPSVAGGRTVVDVHRDPDDVPALLAGADLLVCAAGSTVWEACTLGLPCIAFTVAGNQAANAEALVARGAGVAIPATASSLETFAGVLARLASDADLRVGMSRAAAELCDGRGCERIATALGDAVVDMPVGHGS